MSIKVPLYAKNELFVTSDDNILLVDTDIEYNVELKLYKNISENNRVDKTEYLTLYTILKGCFKTSTSLTKPIITITGSNIKPEFNYAYITQLDRYYFVDDIVSVRKNVWEIYLTVDVLYTYKDYIRELEGFIERSESEYNKLLIDDRNPILNDYEYHTYKLSLNPNVDLFEVQTEPLLILNGLGIEVKED